MSVLMRIDMPKHCLDCPCLDREWTDCNLDSYKPRREVNLHERPEWCPLVEVPMPHGRLIDSKDVLSQLQPDKDEMWNRAIEYVGLFAPTVIEAEG